MASPSIVPAVSGIAESTEETKVTDNDLLARFSKQESAQIIVSVVPEHALRAAPCLMLKSLFP